MVVLFSHLIMVPSFLSPTMQTLVESPLGIIVRGHESVMFFFLLSGFVLSLPFLSGSQPNYAGYLIKRFFRIYVPYIISFFVVILLHILSPMRTGEGISGEVQSWWSHSLNWRLFMEHISGIFLFDAKAVNIVYWSLVHEMRISIIFPFIVIILCRFKWFFTAISGLACFVLAIALSIDSLHYLSFFIYGLLLARYRSEAAAWIRSRRSLTRIAILLMSYICYTYATFLPLHVFAKDQIVGLGAGGFIATALASRRIGSALQTRIPMFLGHISYSLYLYHIPVLLSLVFFFYGIVPIPYLLIASVAIAIALAYVGWRYIEVPAIFLGRRLADNVIRARRYERERYLSSKAERML